MTLVYLAYRQLLTLRLPDNYSFTKNGRAVNDAFIGQATHILFFNYAPQSVTFICLVPDGSMPARLLSGWYEVEKRRACPF